MNLQVRLSNNLVLHYLEENVVDNNNRLVSIQFNFSFYDEFCVAIISRKCLDSDFGSVAFAESPSEIHDSFVEVIQEIHWEALKGYWYQFEKEYNECWPVEEDN